MAAKGLLSQQSDGKVPTVAPAYPNFGENPFTYTPEWGVGAVIIPRQVHQWYGDTAVLNFLLLLLLLILIFPG
jgi:hypothetical protein